MAPKKRAGKGSAAQPTKTNDMAPPTPFKRPPEVLAPFISKLSKKHIYITHIDSKPVDLKWKVFLVPVAMNVGVIILFCLRMWFVLPWYWKLLAAGLGQQNETLFQMSEATWSQSNWEIAKRAFSFFLDFILIIFVWPWPVEFVAAHTHSNPCQWRWKVGFRPKEIYVRRSRNWDEVLKDIFSDKDSMTILLGYVKAATNPMKLEQKTGYLLMDGHWDLDWAKMTFAHTLVDKKEVALDAFRNIVLVHHRDYGWMLYDRQVGAASSEDERRRQVFAFRDHLTSIGKEDLFYRWIEIVQYEATQPGGFGPEKQEVAAKKIRDMFEADDLDFDALWKDAVGALEI